MSRARIVASFVLALLFALSSAVARADTTAPGGKAAPASRVLATLERTACYGTCPIYKLTIFSDGRVEWVGMEFVKVKGRADGTLTPAELAALRAAFAQARYLELEGKFDCYEVTDHSSANTSFEDGGRKKAIHHYHGCKSAPHVAELTALEDKIDRIARTERWIGSEAEREQLRREGKLR